MEEIQEGTWHVFRAGSSHVSKDIKSTGEDMRCNDSARVEGKKVEGKDATWRTMGRVHGIDLHPSATPSMFPSERFLCGFPVERQLYRERRPWFSLTFRATMTRFIIAIYVLATSIGSRMIDASIRSRISVAPFCFRFPRECTEKKERERERRSLLSIIGTTNHCPDGLTNRDERATMILLGIERTSDVNR